MLQPMHPWSAARSRCSLCSSAIHCMAMAALFEVTFRDTSEHVQFAADGSGRGGACVALIFSLEVATGPGQHVPSPWGWDCLRSQLRWSSQEIERGGSIVPGPDSAHSEICPSTVAECVELDETLCFHARPDRPMAPPDRRSCQCRGRKHLEPSDRGPAMGDIL